MEFKKSDFDQCLINPLDYRFSEELVEVCEQFHYEEFTKHLANGLSRNKILKYIVFVYDKNTPLKQLSDINKMKTKAAELVRFEKKKDEWTRPVQDILLCNNPVVNNMIMRYVRSHNNHNYSYYIALQEEYYRLLNRLLSGQSGVNDSKQITTVQDELEKAKDKLLNNDKNLDEDLAAFHDYEELRLRPEFIIHRIKENEPTVEAE